MREILFRGKREDNGEWVYGTPIFYTATNRVVMCKEYEPNHNVISETVGQYTGLKDRNGKRIYEGDILKGYQYPFYNEFDDVFNYYAIAMWFETAFGLLSIKAPKAKVLGRSAGNVDDMSDFDSDEWEIIGNTHDNPELLEEELT